MKAIKIHSFFALIYLFAFLSAALCLGVAKPSLAKDSLDYIEDGEMTQEEMEEEAMYVLYKCSTHLMQRTYFNCDCVGGKFLIEREKRGPLVYQHDIEKEIYTSPICVNKPVIAGIMYEDCLSYAAFFRSDTRNYGDYCTCAANTMADNFSKAPSLLSRHIQRLRSNALVRCEFPTRNFGNRL